LHDGKKGTRRWNRSERKKGRGGRSRTKGKEVSFSSIGRLANREKKGESLFITRLRSGEKSSDDILKNQSRRPREKGGGIAKVHEWEADHF